MVGAGAMGSIYAAMFHEGGHQVSFVEANPATAKAINAAGAVITDAEGKDTAYPLKAASKPSKDDGIADLVLFQVKGFATAAAAETMRPAVDGHTIIVTLQNGLGNEDVLRQAFPGNPLVIGVSLHSAAMTGPGRYHHTGVRSTSIGPSAASARQAVATVAAALRGSRYEVHEMNEGEIRREIFSKWVLNCGSLPTAALTGLATTAISTNE
ncbi:MAG TPA: 2-dehydropantoate 2-reductase N-terminal domain-containing protein, partial [Bauldia sp.]|nr:2-dehydropantoate 2-reductase N-terminal domain-containing protein [Bauldia sp.]